MPQPGRAYWKAFLRLSLVAIPVEIYNAAETQSAMAVNQIHKPSGKRINDTKTVKGIGPVPADEHAAEGYLVIRDALRGMNKLGVGQITMSGREHMAAAGAVEDGLVMDVLRYKDELRPAKPFFSDLPAIKLDKEMVELAREFISR